MIGQMQGVSVPSRLSGCTLVSVECRDICYYAHNQVMRIVVIHVRGCPMTGLSWRSL